MLGIEVDANKFNYIHRNVLLLIYIRTVQLRNIISSSCQLVPQVCQIKKDVVMKEITHLLAMPDQRRRKDVIMK
jgi:hypothetical protein